MSAVLHEYENQNARRRYPFTDNALLVDVDGTELTDDFILDAHLYPLLPAGVGLYLGTIDTALRTLTLYRSDTNTAYAYADIPVEPGASTVLETSAYARQVGVLVFGPGVQNLYAGATVRTFTAQDASFCATTMINISQTGVRGFILPDGTLVTGAVSFQGQDGVLVTSTANGLTNGTLRIDIVGTVDPLPELCDDGVPPISGITVTRLAGSPFMISKLDDNTLALTAFGYDLDDVCAAAKAKYLPDSTGKLPNTPTAEEVETACSPDPDVVPVAPVDPAVPPVLQFSIGGSLYPTFTVMATTLMSVRNAIKVSSVEPIQAPSTFSTPKVVQDTNELTTLMRSRNLKQFPKNGIMIGFRGI